MQATETLSGSSASSSSNSDSDSSNSSGESDNENSESEDVCQGNSVKNLSSKKDDEMKDPVQEARRYNQRYNLLMERINAINQDNEHLVSRILEVRGLCRIGRRHRAAIMKRLDSHGNNYKNIPVTIQIDKDNNPASSSHLSSALLPASLSDLSIPHAPLPSQTKRSKKKSKRGIPPPEDSDQGEAKRASGLPREPGMPKRPHNAFFYYSQEKRPRMQKDFPNLSKKEIAGILSARWSQIPTEEKLPFLKLEEERRKEYRQALQRYKEGLS